MYFVSDRAESAQVWQRSLDGEEARQITDYPLDVGSFRVAPNGRTLIFAARTAMQGRGIDSRLLYFPDKNHWVLKPANSILWHDTVNAWLQRWLGDPHAGENVTR